MGKVSFSNKNELTMLLQIKIPYVNGKKVLIEEIYFEYFPTKQEVITIMQKKHNRCKDNELYSKLYFDSWLKCINTLTNTLKWYDIDLMMEFQDYSILVNYFAFKHLIQFRILYIHKDEDKQ